MTADAWDPDQYARFAAERTQPFRDLLALLHPVPGGRAVDLGCGTGELTAVAAATLETADMLGIDNSAAMLERAAPRNGPGLRFVDADIAAFPEPGTRVDVVLSNAALHWVPNHAIVLAQWRSALAPGGQLAVQVPANVDHVSHRLAAEVALEEFATAFDGDPPPDAVLSVLAPEAYAVLLDQLGFAEQHVRLQVYGHRMASPADVVEWVKGTTLTRFSRVLPPDVFEQYVARYRARLLTVLGAEGPYFYAFKRILMWGRLPA